MSSIPMTREGYNKIKAEVERMEFEEMPVILERIATARAEGDLKENAEYHGARESQGLLQARINDLKSKLNNAAILDPSSMPQGEIRFGAKITVQKTGTKKPTEYTLVGAGEEDFDVGKIPVTSPLAQGFLGKKKGDVVQIQVPKGLQEFTVLDVVYE
jgi:transcription elongation factor GreA